MAFYFCFFLFSLMCNHSLCILLNQMCFISFSVLVIFHNLLSDGQFVNTSGHYKLPISR